MRALAVSGPTVKGLAPIVMAAVAMAGCARVEVPDGPTLLGRSHQAEMNLCYTTSEVNEQVLTGAWPRKGAGARSTDRLMYGRPVVTLVKRTQCGPHQKRYEVVASDAPGGHVAGTVVAQNGSGGWRYIPSAQRIDILTFPASEVDPLNWLALVLNNYEVRDVRRDRVAGIAAWHLRLQPRNPARPVKRMWLDTQTYLPLRQEMWGPDGRLLSATQVTGRPKEQTAANAAREAMDLMDPPIHAGGGSVRVVHGDQDWLMPEGDLRARLGYPLGQMAYLPEGFVVAGSYLYICPDALGPSARWELTDGVATVNVIQTRVEMSELDGLDTPGDVQGPIRTAQRGPYHFVVRGNLPAEELERIANGITVGIHAVPARR